MSDDNTLQPSDEPQEDLSNHIKYRELTIKSESEDRLIVTNCFVCDKILGGESRDLEMWTCHDHRNCTKCGTFMQSPEIKWCYRNNFPLIHARCVITSLQRAQISLDLMNMQTKIIWPDPILTEVGNQESAKLNARLAFHEQTLEDAYLTLQRMQAGAAVYSFLLQSDKGRIEKDNADKARKDFKEVQSQRDTPKSPKKGKGTKGAKEDISELTPEEKFIKKFIKDSGGIFTREQAAKIYADGMINRAQNKEDNTL